MNLLFYSSILYLFLPISIWSTKLVTTKICANCKHFMPYKTIDKYGKCTRFPLTDNASQMEYLVTGVKTRPDYYYYYYCSTARTYDDMCGIEGKLYEDRDADKKE